VSDRLAPGISILSTPTRSFSASSRAYTRSRVYIPPIVSELVKYLLEKGAGLLAVDEMGAHLSWASTNTGAHKDNKYSSICRCRHQRLDIDKPNGKRQDKSKHND
jgi:hypothetical protein